ETEARAAETEQRKVAEANYQKAKAAVDKYFTQVSESTLLDVPGLQSLRKDLLESSLEFYQGAALDRTSDPAGLVDGALLHLAVAHLRVGYMYYALDRFEDHLDKVDRALDVIDRLRRDHPQAGEHERKLAGWIKGNRRAWTTSAQGVRDPVSAHQTGLRYLAA